MNGTDIIGFRFEHGSFDLIPLIFERLKPDVQFDWSIYGTNNFSSFVFILHKSKSPCCITGAIVSIVLSGSDSINFLALICLSILKCDTRYSSKVLKVL